MPNNFIWSELMTSDPAAAETFYRAVVGWGSEPAPSPNADYRAMTAGGRGLAGLMAIPADAAGAKPGWFGYIHVDDVDAAAKGVSAAGGTVHRPPADIPGVGRFAVVADPQGAMFMLLAPTGEDTPPAPVGTPGRTAWHELHARDWEAAFGFYAGQFGWTKADAMDMGPMGKYQLFAAGGDPIGAMFNDAKAPSPFWLYYFTVADIDAASALIAKHGGKVSEGPHQVPGDDWIIQATDPQGATFALVGKRGAIR